MDGCTLDGEVCTFHHSVGLGSARFGEAVFGGIAAGLVEEPDLVCGGAGLALEEAVGELLAVVGENGLDFEGEELTAAVE